MHAEISPEPRDLTIGLFGPRGIVDLMVEAGDDVRAARPEERIRFVTGVHHTMAEARERFEHLADRIDAAVLPGPWHFDRAGAAGYRSVPASYVHLSGEALYATLLRGVLHEGLDPCRVSIDSLAHAAVEETYRELQLPEAGIEVMPYASPDDVERFEAFHREAHESGRARCALTTIRSVESALRHDGIPVLRIRPTPSTVRRAVESAITRGLHSRAEDQQIAFVLVRLLGPGTAGAPYWEQQAGLTVQRQLIAHARPIGATVTRRTDTEFLLTTTSGGVDRLTDSRTRTPFRGPVGRGVPLAVGIGTGITAHGAETNALSAVELSARADGTSTWAVEADGSRTELPHDTPARGGGALSRSDGDPDTERIARTLARRAGDPPADLGADDVARLLGLSVRSGHRTVKRLVEAGYAWPLPVHPAGNGGRPRRLYRLLVHTSDPDTPQEDPLDP